MKYLICAAVVLISFVALAQSAPPSGPMLSAPSGSGGGGGGSGTVSSGTTPNAAFYAATGTTVSSTPVLQFPVSGGAVFNEAGTSTDGFRVESDTNANMLVVDAVNNRVAIGAAASVAVDFMVAGTTSLNPPVGYAGSGFSFFATEPTSGNRGFVVNTGISRTSGTQEGTLVMSTAGSGADSTVNLRLLAQPLSGGAYTAAGTSTSLWAQNVVAGTGTGGLLGSTALNGVGGGANYGGFFQTSVATNGHNIGSLSTVNGSTVLNVGAGATANGGARAIGVHGAASGATANVGGYFASDVSVPLPTLTSAALMADNNALAVPIFVARDNGTAVFTVGDNGALTSTGSTWAISNDLAVSLAGGVNGVNFDANTMSIDATNDRVGIGTAAPSTTLEVAGTINTSGATDDIVSPSNQDLRLRAQGTGSVQLQSGDSTFDILDSAGVTRGLVSVTPNFRLLGSDRLMVGMNSNIGSGTIVFEVVDNNTTPLFAMYGDGVQAAAGGAALALSTPTDVATSPLGASSGCRMSSTGVSAWTPSETGAVDKMYLCCTNTGANAITMTTSAGVYQGSGSVVGQHSQVCMEYVTDRWIERSFSPVGGFLRVDASNDPLTGQLAVAVGTEALPGLAFAGDEDTGFQRVSANTIGISTNAARRVTVSDTGVGIGIAPSTMFQVAGTSTMRNVDPQTDVLYDFGNVGAYWADLYLSNAIKGKSDAKAVLITDVDGVAINGGGQQLTYGPTNILNLPRASTTTYTNSLRLPGGIYSGGGVAGPSCSGSSDAAKVFYVDRVADGVAADVCICTASSADTYSLRKLSDLAVSCDPVP